MNAYVAQIQSSDPPRLCGGKTSCLSPMARSDELAEFKLHLYPANLEKCSPSSNYAHWIFYVIKHLVLIMCLPPKPVIICQGEELFTSLMKSSIKVCGRGRRRGVEQRVHPKRKKNNCFHFISPRSRRRRGHGHEREEEGGSVKELITGGK